MATALDAAAASITPASRTMRIRKRDGTLEPVDVNKIVRAVQRCAQGLERVDPLRVATRTISGLCDGATSSELDALSIRTAAALVVEEPEYSRLAARLLGTTIDKEVRNAGIFSFSQSIAAGAALGLVAPETEGFVGSHARKLDDAVDTAFDLAFELFGLRTVYDRYLLRHPRSRHVIETPQYFLLRVACGLSAGVDSAGVDEATSLYRTMAAFDWLPSSPTLFNAGTTRPQLSSCYLLDSPADDLGSIYDTYKSVAKLSKHAGGIGLAFHRIRGRGSLIAGTNGLSNGIVPFLKTLDASVAAVNQGGRRKGACCVYLESWHPDIEEFLELRDSTGDESLRAHHLNLANWVPDLFMRRVENDWMWSLFDPSDVPGLCDLHGPAFDEAYQRAEEEGRAVRQVRARDLYSRMMRTLAETGNGWMTFKDAANRTCNQAADPSNVVHLSNLCTEILEVTDAENTAVCNLGSVNLARFVSEDGQVDMGRLGEVVRHVVGILDRVIDLNWYPADEAQRSNQDWRPVGLGVMGLQDVFFKLGLPFDSAGARDLSQAVAEEIYLSALERSAELAAEHGPHPRYEQTWAARGRLSPDLWGLAPQDSPRWAAVRSRIAEAGLRNSLLVALAPTATIASIAGCYECIEPQVSNLFKRETLSGEFLQVNRYLVRDLQRLGRWNESTIAGLIASDGSVADLGLPAEMASLYRTAWELPMRSLIDMAADRGPFVDQGQSLNLFVARPGIGGLSSMYMHAWKKGLKTTYYLRSRPASRITTTGGAPGVLACDLEDPENCEACQ